MKFLNWRLIVAIKPRLVSPLVGAVLLGGFLVSGASATTTPTTFYACVNFNTGTIYMIQGDGQCKSSEYTKISWNQTGPAGPAGSAGPQGPAGPAGPTQTLSVQKGVASIIVPAQSGVGGTQAGCNTGTVVSGGFLVSTNATSGWSVIRNEVVGNTWLVEVDNESSDDITLFVTAVCVTLS